MVFIVVIVVSAERGGDVVDLVDVKTFQCAVKNGWTFAIVRSYHGLKRAAEPSERASRGMQQTDVYHFPCYQQFSLPSAQVSADYTALQNAGATFGTMWFDIETNPDSNCAWNEVQSLNCEFLNGLIEGGKL